jgi:enediyne biosynthesis protein E3
MRRTTLLVRRLLTLSLDHAEFSIRGFTACEPSRRSALEKIGRCFLGAYNAALVADEVTEIAEYVGRTAQADRGFAVEGAAMGAAVGDAVRFRQQLLPACVNAFQCGFTYLLHVGAGWALARVPWRHRQILASLDPKLRWLAYDGLGFHDTYFYSRRVSAGWRRQRAGYAARAYDQGVGRGLWFITGGSLPQAIDLIEALPVERQSDLWSGLGLAMAYAGPVVSDEIVRALLSAGDNGTHYAQGIAFACEARALANHIPAFTHLAAATAWGQGGGTLSLLVREVRDRLPKGNGDPPRYELWRRGVAAAFLRVAGPSDD